MRGFLTLWLVMLLAAVQLPAQAVPVIFDTDMGNDIDDALALAMLHAFESRGEARLLAVTITKDNRCATPYTDLVNTFYGRPHIPIGVPNSGITPNDSRFACPPVERRLPDGSYVYPHQRTHEAAPDAVEVLRRTLVGEADSSVVVIQVGFSSNLARLLDSPPDAVSPLGGRDLVARKVRLLSIMAGDFAHALTQSEYNVRHDIPAARKVFAEWPTPVVASGWEVGNAIRYPAESIERDYRYVENHPVAEGYHLYRDMPYDRPSWDLTSVLYAIRPEAEYFDLSAPGRVTVDEEGFTNFRRTADGPHRYLRIGADAQRDRSIEAMIYLASQPPTR
jgi:purine nucleosidase